MQLFEQGISIVICTFNGAHRLEPTLTSIFHQQHTQDIPWELIIIDNASTDGSSQLCERLISENRWQNRSRVIFEAKQGCNHARLRGLMECKYKWMLFCDDDNHLFPDYLQKGWLILQEHPEIGVLGGTGLPVFEEKAPDWFEEFGQSYAVGAQNVSDGPLPINSPRKLYSAGAFFNREILSDIYAKGFLPIMEGPKGNELTRGEDTEWCMLIELSGNPLWYDSRLKFHHYMPASRLQWSYYRRLKSGIASGEAKLFPYTYYYKNKRSNVLGFITAYFFQWIKSMLIFLKRVSKVKEKEKSLNGIDKSQLGLEILQAKLKSYRNDFSVSLAHYRQIKSLFQDK